MLQHLKTISKILSILAVLCASTSSTYAQRYDDDEDQARGWGGGISIGGGYSLYQWQFAGLNQYVASYNAQPGINTALGSTWRQRNPYHFSAEVDFGLLSLAYARHFVQYSSTGTLNNNAGHVLEVKAPSNNINVYLMLPLTKFRIGAMTGYHMQKTQIKSYELVPAGATALGYPYGTFRAKANNAFVLGGRVDVRPLWWLCFTAEYANADLFGNDNKSSNDVDRRFEIADAVAGQKKYFPRTIADINNTSVINDGTNALGGMYRGWFWNFRVSIYPYAWY